MLHEIRTVFGSPCAVLARAMVTLKRAFTLGPKIACSIPRPLTAFERLVQSRCSMRVFPENGTIFNASVSGFGISGVSLGVGEVAYVTTPAVPEPGTLVLFWIGLAGLRLMQRRRSR